VGDDAVANAICELLDSRRMLTMATYGPDRGQTIPITIGDSGGPPVELTPKHKLIVRLLGNNEAAVTQSGKLTLVVLSSPNATIPFRASFNGVRSIEVSGPDAVPSHITLGDGLKFTTVHGGPNNDIIIGGDGDSAIYGGGGDDELHGGRGSDSLYGEAGNDRLFGDTGDDLLEGGAGKDHLDGGKGKNKLAGGGGTDYITVRGGKDKTDRDVKDKLKELG
jgi:Ca2+-binding RTX toxin-like protein